MVGVGIAEIAKQAAYVALCVCVFPADQLHFSFQADALDGYGLTLGHVLIAHQAAYGDVIHPGGGVLYRQIPDGHNSVAFRVDFQGTCACIIQVNMAEQSSRILTAVLNSHAEGGCRPDIAVRQLHILGIGDSYLCRRGVAREAAGHNQRPNGQILIGAVDKPGFVFELGIKPNHANEASGGGAAQGVSVDAGILQRNPIEDNGVGSVGAEAADEHTRRRHIGPFRLIPQGVAVIQDIACLAGVAIAVKVGDSGLSGEDQVGEGGIRGIAHRQEQAGAADRPFVLLRHILVALLVQGNDRPIAVGFFSVRSLKMQLAGIVVRRADVDAHIAAADSPEAVAVIRHVAVRREPDGKQTSQGSQLAEIPGHIFAQIALRRGLRCQADPTKAGVVLPGGGNVRHGIASDSGAAEAVGLVAVHRRGAAVGNGGKQPQPLRVLHRSGDIVARQRNRQVGIQVSPGGNIGNFVILIRIFQGNAVSQHIAVQHPSHIGIVVELAAGFAGLPAGQAGADLPPEHHAAAILILAAVAGSAEGAAHKSHIAAHRRQIGMAALGLRQVRNGNRNAVQNGVAAKGIAHYASKEGRADFAAGRLVAAQGNTSGIFDLDVANHAAHAVLDQAAKLAGCAARDGEGVTRAVNLAAEGDDLTAGLAGGVRMTQAVPAVVGGNVLFQLVVGVLQIEPHNRRFHGGSVLAFPFARIRRIGIAYMSAVHIVSGVLVRIREGLLLLDVCQHLGVQIHRPVLGGAVPEHQIQGLQLAELGEDIRIRPGSAANLQSGGVQVHIQLVLGAANGQIFRLVDITCVILIEAVPAVGTAADQFVFQLSAVVPTLLIVVPAGDRAVCRVGQLPPQGALILLRLGKVIDAAGGLHIVKGLQEQSPAENAAGRAILHGVVPSGAAIQAHLLEGQPDFLAGIAAHPADETAGGIFVGVQILVAGGGFHAVHVQGTVAAQAVNQQGLFRRTGADPDSRQIHILDRQIHPGIDGTAGEGAAAQGSRAGGTASHSAGQFQSVYVQILVFIRRLAAVENTGVHLIVLAVGLPQRLVVRARLEAVHGIIIEGNGRILDGGIVDKRGGVEGIAAQVDLLGNHKAPGLCGEILAQAVFAVVVGIPKHQLRCGVHGTQIGAVADDPGFGVGTQRVPVGIQIIVVPGLSVDPGSPQLRLIGIAAVSVDKGMAGKGNGHNAVVVCGLVAAHNFVKILGATDIHGSALGLVSVLPDFQVQGGVPVLFALGHNQTAGGALLGFAGESIAADKVNAVGLRRRALLHPPIAGAGIDQTAETGVGASIQSAVFHGNPGDGGRGVGPFVAQQAAAGGVGAGGDFQAVYSQAVDGHGLVIASHGSNQAAHRGVRPARVRLVDGAGKGAVCCRDFGFAFAFCAEAAQITLRFGGIDYFPRPPAVGEVCLLGGGEQSRNPASPKVIGLRLRCVQQRSRAAGDLGQGSPALGFGAQCADVQGSVRMGSDTALQGKIGGGEIRGFCKETLAVVVRAAGVDRDIRQGDGVTVAVQRDADFLGIIHIPLEAGNADVLQIIHIRGQVNGLGRTVLDVAPIKFQGVGFIQLIAQGQRRKFGGTAHRVGTLRAVGSRHRDGAHGRVIGQHAGQIVGANHLTPAADVIGGALLGVPALIGID